MAGHSHWARIKRAKGVTDARRGKLWSKLSRAVIVAARGGGGDPDGNLALRYAIDACRAENMPKDTIERAIKKGTGEAGAGQIEELVYEGYGPGGVAVLVQALTDNRNRTAGEVRKVFEVYGGNLGAANSVARLFRKRGVFIIARTAADEDTLTNIALEAGADDVQSLGDAWEMDCEPAAYNTVLNALHAANIKPESSELTMVASTTVTLAGEQAERMMKLIDALDDIDDVQQVHTNFELSEEDAERLSS